MKVKKTSNGISQLAAPRHPNEGGAGNGQLGGDPSKEGHYQGEVLEKAQRRRLTKAYKLKILLEAEECNKRGELGALLRREGLYSSSLSSWKKQREKGLLERKRGKKGDIHGKLLTKNKQLKRQNDRLNEKLRRAHLIIDIQKKASEMLEIPLPTDETSGRD